MAKGHDRHKARQEAISFLGKSLIRRSGSKCELCEVAGESLGPVEVEPIPEEPHADQAIIICKQCQDGVDGAYLDPVRWRFLESVIWSEIPPVQVTAVRLCRRLAVDDCRWAADLLENLYLSPEIEEWAG